MVHRTAALHARTTSETQEGAAICTGVNPISYKTYHYGCMAFRGYDIILDPERLKWRRMRGYVKSYAFRLLHCHA
jgi:hypothetical protein